MTVPECHYDVTSCLDYGDVMNVLILLVENKQHAVRFLMVVPMNMEIRTPLHISALMGHSPGGGGDLDIKMPGCVCLVPGPATQT